MHRRWYRRLAVVLLLPGIMGCAAALKTHDPAAETSTTWNDSASTNKPTPPVSPYAAGQLIPSPSPVSPYLNPPPASVAQPPAAQASSSAPNNAAAANNGPAMQKIMAELQSLGTIDPAVQQQLLADLQQTDPALWPMLMQTFRAGAAYRQKQAFAKVVPTTNESPAKPARGTSTVSNDSQIVSTPPTSVPASSTPPQVTATGVAPLSALSAMNGPMNLRGSSSSPGLTFPATSMLTAALAEAQRQEAAAAATVPESAVVPLPPVVASPTVAASKTVSHEEPAATADPNDWRASLARSITALEAQTKEPPRSAQETSQHAWLRMLYLAAGRRDDALKPIAGISAAEQDYWTSQVYALSTYLDTEKLTDPTKRSSEAARHLAKAHTRLAETGTLVIKNLAFCTEVSSFGVYEKFKDDAFKANQPIILYAEVENFKSEETAKGFHTALRSSYQILDAQGRRVSENDLALTEEYCQNHRRDYFIRYFLSVPERIYAGKYVLQLTIVDTLSQKIGQATIDFNVVEK